MDLQALIRPNADGRRPGRRFGRLLITSTVQPDGAPFMDRGRSADTDGNDYRCRVFSPTRPGRRTHHKSVALVVGWRR